MAGMAAVIFGRLFDLIPTIDAGADIQVLYGTRATQLMQDVVGVTAIVTEISRPTLGNVPRSRDEAHVVTIVASVFRPGPDNQRDAVETAFGYIDAIAEWLRVGNNPTLGLNGNVDGYVSNTDLDIQADNEEIQDAGRYAAVTATLQVAAFRI